MNTSSDFLTARYQQLWDESADAVRHGNVSVDPLLARREPDRRRCLTVLARPANAVQNSVAAFLHQLRSLDPDQYYYAPSELHVTVLSLFTATLEYERLLARYEDYLAAVNTALAQAPAFAIEFTGVTLSREAIMIQGFPADSTLNHLRESLRRELRSRNLTEGLDGRYLLQTAHLTVARFQNPLRDSENFVRTLEKHRSHPFGQTRVQELHLVRNDWYMSQPSVEVLQPYQLSSNSAPQVSPPF